MFNPLDIGITINPSFVVDYVAVVVAITMVPTDFEVLFAVLKLLFLFVIKCFSLWNTKLFFLEIKMSCSNG